MTEQFDTIPFMVEQKRFNNSEVVVVKTGGKLIADRLNAVHLYFPDFRWKEVKTFSIKSVKNTNDILFYVYESEGNFVTIVINPNDEQEWDMHLVPDNLSIYENTMNEIVKIGNRVYGSDGYYFLSYKPLIKEVMVSGSDGGFYYVKEGKVEEFEAELQKSFDEGNEDEFYLGEDPHKKHSHLLLDPYSVENDIKKISLVNTCEVEAEYSYTLCDLYDFNRMVVGSKIPNVHKLSYKDYFIEFGKNLNDLLW